MDDDWDALGGASDATPAPAAPADSDPFGGDDPFGAPEAAPDATGGGLDDFAPADGGLDDFAPAADGGLDDMFGGGDASAAPADDMFGGNAAPAAAAAPADDMFGGDDLMGSSAPAPSANDMDDMFGSAPAEAAAEAPAAVPSMFAPEPVAHEDNSLIEEWEKKARAVATATGGERQEEVCRHGSGQDSSRAIRVQAQDGSGAGTIEEQDRRKGHNRLDGGCS